MSTPANRLPRVVIILAVTFAVLNFGFLAGFFVGRRTAPRPAPVVTFITNLVEKPVAAKPQNPSARAPRKPPMFRITSTPPAFAQAEEPYRYKVNIAPDTNVTFAIESGPDGMSIDPANGRVTWTPSLSSTGTFAVALSAADDFGRSVTQRFSVAVSPLTKVSVVDEPAQFCAPLPGELLVVSTPARLKIVSQRDVNEIIASRWLGSRTHRWFEFYKGCVYLPEQTGVSVFDVNNPKSLRLASSLDVPTLGNATLDLNDGKLFVPDARGKLRIFSLNEPAKPVELGSVDVAGPQKPWAVRVSSNIAYVVTANSVFSVNVADPAAPRVLFEFAATAPFGLGALAVGTDYGYLYTAHQITTLDLRNPSEIRVAGTAGGVGQTPMCSHALLHGNRLYASGMNGTFAFDISYPAEPRPIGGAARGLIPGKQGGFVVSESGVATPSNAGKSPPPSDFTSSFQGWNVVVHGNYCYEIGEGIRTFDLSDPANPRLIGTTRFGNYNYMPRTQVLRSGDFLYMPNAIVDLSAPKTPRILRGLTGGTGIAVRDSLAVISQTDRIEFWDVSNPENPVQKTSLPDTNRLGKLAVKGDVLFAAAGPKTLRAYRLIDGPGLELISELPIEARDPMILDMVLENNRLYLALNGAGVAAIDVSDPAKMQFASWYDTPQFTEIVQVRDGIAYAADGSGGVMIIDLRKRGSGAVLGQYDTTDWTPALGIGNGYLYAAEGKSGLAVFSCALLKKVGP